MIARSLRALLVIACVAVSANACLLLDDFSDVRSASGGAPASVSSGVDGVTGVTSSSKAGQTVTGVASHASSTATGLSGACLGAPNGLCQSGEACGVCSDCVAHDCDFSACSDDGSCSNDPLCVCADCLASTHCSCHDDGVCNRYTETCNCADCVNDEACL